MSIEYWKGERVRLRALEPEDWETHHTWDQDSQMARAIDYVWLPRSRASAKRWAEEGALRPPEADAFRFEIENLDGELVGSMNTMDCDRRVGSFSYGIGVRAEYQRKGYASEAILLVCHYFFEELRYQKVVAGAFSYNDASIGLHESLGFQLEGRLRRMAYTGGRYYDALYFGMTAEEFAARHGTRRIAGFALEPEPPAGA